MRDPAAARTKQFKDTEGGRSIMSTVWQEALAENAQRVTQQANEAAAIRMLKNGESEEKTVLYSSLPLATVQNLAKAVALGLL